MPNDINFIQNRINKNINALEDVKGLISLAKNIFDFYVHLSRLILYLIPFYHVIVYDLFIYLFIYIYDL